MSSYLEMYLGPLLPDLLRPEVTDIYVNCPGELWVELTNGTIERHENFEIDEALLGRLARQIASITHQGISREHPLLAATLSGGERVQVIAPPATRGPMAVAVRKHVSSDLSLAHLKRDGVFTPTVRGSSAAEADRELKKLYDEGDWPAFLANAVRARKTIIVSGGTSTGKTTFVNALMKEIPSGERLILIEDTPELVLHHENAIGLVAVRGSLGEANVSADALLTASLRMRPDRIIVGELRGPEAMTFLRAVNTGHPGSLSTIHADSPKGALEQLTFLALQTGIGLTRTDLLHYCCTVIDVIVQLQRSEGRRSVSSIMVPAYSSESSSWPDRF